MTTLASFFGCLILLVRKAISHEESCSFTLVPVPEGYCHPTGADFGITCTCPLSIPIGLTLDGIERTDYVLFRQAKQIAILIKNLTATLSGSELVCHQNSSKPATIRLRVSDTAKSLHVLAPLVTRQPPDERNTSKTSGTVAVKIVCRVVDEEHCLNSVSGRGEVKLVLNRTDELDNPWDISRTGNVTDFATVLKVNDAEEITFACRFKDNKHTITSEPRPLESAESSPTQTNGNREITDIGGIVGGIVGGIGGIALLVSLAIYIRTNKKGPQAKTGQSTTGTETTMDAVEYGTDPATTEDREEPDLAQVQLPGSPGDTLVSVNEETVQSESSSDPGSLSSSQTCLAGASVQQNRKIGTGINDGTTIPRQSIHSIHGNSGSDNIEHGADNSGTEAARDSYLHESSTEESSQSCGQEVCQPSSAVTAGNVILGSNNQLDVQHHHYHITAPSLHYDISISKLTENIHGHEETNSKKEQVQEDLKRSQQTMDLGRRTVKIDDQLLLAFNPLRRVVERIEQQRDGHELKEGGPSVVDIRSDSQSNLEVFVEQSTPNKAAARNHGPTYFSEHLEEESEFLSTVPGPGQRQMTSVFPQTEEKTSQSQEVLRKHSRELVGRVNPDRVIVELFEKKVINYYDLEDLTEDRARYKKARVLLNRIWHSPDHDIRLFAEVLSRTRGIEDLGYRLLEDLDSIN